MELTKPGPHQVLRGDLGMVGLPGVIFAPAEGLGLPALAFGHDWLQPPQRYAELLRHLASWGIVAAAPGSQRGPLPSHVRFAGDLRTTLEVCAGVRLGNGQISVDPTKQALAGHGMGGGCAVLAAASDAADRGRVVAVVTLAAAATNPPAVQAARSVTVPTLHLVAGKDQVTPPVGHAEPLAAAGAGPVWLRTLPKADHLSFVEGRHWSDLVVAGSPKAATRKLTRALITAFLLRTLTGNDRYDELVDGKVPGTKLDISPSATPTPG